MDLAFLEETKFCLPARRSCRKPSPAFPSPCPHAPRPVPHQRRQSPYTASESTRSTHRNRARRMAGPVGSDAYSWGLSSSENTSSGATS